ncbi:MAG: tail fiber domain-containing protein, partial [Bacteroidota bacterium]
MKRLVFIITLLGLSVSLFAQSVGINPNGSTPDASAMLDVQATNKGMLIPRMNSINRTAIVNPVEGLMVYDSTTHSFWYYQQGWRELGVNTSTRLQDADQDTYIAVEQNPDEDIIRMNAKGKEIVRINTLHTFIESNLSAGVGFSLSSTLVVNYTNVGPFSLTSDNIPGWQSFKATSRGKLDNINILFGTAPLGIYTISLYEGQGTSGTQLLSTGSIMSPSPSVWNSITFPDEVVLEKDSIYTIGFSSISRVAFEAGNLYPDGLSSIIPDWDFLLRVNLFEDAFGLNLLNNNLGIGTTTPQHMLHLGGILGRKLALYQNAAGTDFYGFAMADTTLEIHAGSNTSSAPDMVITRSGRIGIGTATPTRAKVQIASSVNDTITSYGYLSDNATTPAGYVAFSGNQPYSLYAAGRIACSEFNAFSDARIKQIQGISDGATDLNTLMQIEITDYRMRDSIAKGSHPYKKVIAQQVAEVYPQAVTTDLTEVVPDIYQRAEVQDGWIMLATDLEVGERVKLIMEQSAAVYEVSAVEAGRFQVWEPASQNAFLDLADSTTVFV